MYMHIAVLVSYTIPATYVLIKSRLMMDRAAIINIALFTSCYLIKFVGALLNVLKIDSDFTNYMTIAEFFSDQFVIIGMYVFVFEMLVVYYKVTVKSMREYKQSKEKTFKLKISFTLWMIIYFGIGVTYYTYKAYYKNTNEDNQVLIEILRSIFATARVTLLILDIVTVTTFIYLFIFFVLKKQE